MGSSLYPGMHVQFGAFSLFKPQFVQLLVDTLQVEHFKWHMIASHIKVPEFSKYPAIQGQRGGDSLFAAQF